jgi:hypothetical protein
MPNVFFLHSVGLTGHMVHSSASGARNDFAVFSCLCLPDAVSRKSASGHVVPNLCFASGVICGSRSAIRCMLALIKC